MNGIKLLQQEVKEILKEKRISALEGPDAETVMSATRQKEIQSLYAEAFHRALRRLRFQS